MTEQQPVTDPKAPAAAPVEAPAEAPSVAPAPLASAPGILPTDFWVQMAAQGDAQPQYDEDSDSAYGDDDASSTASLSSSIFKYRTINGRTYQSGHGDGEYWAANDEKANEALDIIHHVLLLSLDGKLHKAPLSNDIQKVVDIGTGTGVWAIDFADEYPDTEVIGTDLSPIQPTWVPPNCLFQIDDCTQPWTFEPNSIDYVHIRWLFGSIKDWEGLFTEAYKALKPGGYIETHEPSVSFRSDDGTVHDKTAMGQFGKFFVEGGKIMGRSMTVVEDCTQRAALEAAGFTDIQETQLKTPIGKWPKDPKMKEIGAFQQMAVEQDTEGTMTYLAQMLGWSQHEVIAYVATLRREIRSRDIHGFYEQKVLVARKPEQTPDPEGAATTAT
ncbi:unnamed protein product [Parascedosporium putredinis]|uniref:Methyltransferase n=1 Tax=Parascedosporium putredinis TaxID=1442378 RepID=A0A9P1MC64_9PEZI|nr:unnamed protein product [Parascedosporium putredinis]CAI7997284.1 unnamed protein product [Parascedosporium putredinis]